MNEMEDKIRKPQQDRSIKTKEAIVQAAMKLFSEKGFHQTNTKQIAAAAGVSTGSFYSYFVDKRAVFIDALTIYSDALLARVEASLAEINSEFMDKRTIITHLIDSLILSHQVYTGFQNELMVMYHSDEGIKQQMDRQYEVGRRLTLEYLQMGKAEIKVSDLEAASFVVFESVSIIVDAIVFSAQGISAERLKSELINMISVYLYG